MSSIKIWPLSSNLANNGKTINAILYQVQVKDDEGHVRNHRYWVKADSIVVATGAWQAEEDADPNLYYDHIAYCRDLWEQAVRAGNPCTGVYQRKVEAP